MKDSNEVVTQILPRRCPYCDQVIAYDRLELKTGENPIECPSCRKIFIRIIPQTETMNDER